MKTPLTLTLAISGFLCSLGAAAEEKAPSFQIEEIRPSEGPVRGGYPMVLYTTPITGEDSIVVDFGGEPVTGTPADSERRVWTFVLPAHAAGTVDVTATAGDQSDTLEAGFTYVVGPVVNEVSPTKVGQAGGNQVDVDGFGFLDPTLRVDGVQVNLLNPRIYDFSFIAPPHLVGNATVTLTNLDGLSTSFTLEYEPLSITGVSPSTVSGYEPAIHITGTGFSPRMDFYIGNTGDQGETFQDHDTMNVYFPNVPPGVYEVAAVDPAGNSFILPDAITITAPGPTITSYSPTDGGQRGGAYVTFNGDDFGFPRDQVKVYFGGVEAQFARFQNWTRDHQVLSVFAPPHEMGVVDIVLENPSGARTVIEDGFNYFGGPDLYAPAELMVNDVIDADSTNAPRESILPFPHCYEGYRAHTYLVRPLESGLLTLTLCADDMYGAIMVRGQGEAETFACQQEYCLSGTSGGPAVLELELEPCNPYEVYVVSQNLQGGPYTLESSFAPDGQITWTPPVNDEPEGALPLEPGWTEADFSCATASPDAPDGGFPLVDLWYAASFNAAGVLYANGGSCDPPFFGLYREDLEPVAMDYQLECGGDPVPLPVRAPGDYLLRVGQLARWQFGSFETTFEAYGEMEGEGIPAEAEGEAVEGEAAADGEAEAEQPVEAEAGIEAEPEGGAEEGQPEPEAESPDGEEGEANGDGEGEGEPIAQLHSADTNDDEAFSLAEVLRVVQLHNAGGHHCNSAGEDGYRVGEGARTCARHSADFIERDWYLSLEEVLRVVQLYNAGGYERCDGGEDGYCIKSDS